MVINQEKPINFLKKNHNCSKIIGDTNFIQIDHGEDVRDFHSWENYNTPLYFDPMSLI